MKIRSKEQLYDELSKDISWRKKEISNLRNLIGTARKVSKDTLIRACVTLVYAHFEGNIKASSEYYLDYLNNQGNYIKSVKPNIAAIELRGLVQDTLREKSLDSMIKLIDLIQNSSERCQNLKSYKVYTGSNLNFERLNNLSTALGVDISNFSNLNKLIDENLLKNRNTIAHGNYMIMDLQELDDIIKNVIKIMEYFVEELYRIAEEKAYLK